jgi:hypothetical protein
VYLFRGSESADEAVHDDHLRTELLLIPPLFVHRGLWTRGYAEHVRETTLSTADRLAEHCFKAPWGHFDEFGVKKAHSEPCGQWSMSTVWTLDDRLSDALGVARAP